MQMFKLLLTVCMYICYVCMADKIWPWPYRSHHLTSCCFWFTSLNLFSVSMVMIIQHDSNRLQCITIYKLRILYLLHTVFKSNLVNSWCSPTPWYSIIPSQMILAGERNFTGVVSSFCQINFNTNLVEEGHEVN